MTKRRHHAMNSGGNERNGADAAVAASAAAASAPAAAAQPAQPARKGLNNGAAASVGNGTLDALEGVLLDAVMRAQQAGDLPAHSWERSWLLVQPMGTVRAATHYTAGVLKAVQGFNALHHPHLAAARSSKPKAKKQKGPAGVASKLDEDVVMKAAEVSDGPSAGAAPPVPVVPTESNTPVADTQTWATVLARHVTQLLADLSAEHPLHGRVTVEVPAPGSSPRPAGFIDFTIQPDPSAIAASAAASASSAAAASSLVSAVPPTGDTAASSTVPSFTFHAIGTISSVFKLRYGTPRQGTIAPSARGSLTLAPHIPAASLEGLEEYSHVWLVFVFHANANKRFAPKVEPPRAQGKKIGIFATRTPHRANPVGLSLVKLDRVDLATKTLHLSALDLIEGTPVLDIKPYHPADCVTDYALPLWMQEQATERPPMPVDFSEEATAELAQLVRENKLQFYRDVASASAAIGDSVRHDPRPRYVKARASPTEVYGFRLDRLNVLYRVDDEQRRVRVVAVQFVDYDALQEEGADEDGAEDAASPQEAALSREERITKKFLQNRTKRSYEAEAQAEVAEVAAAASSAAPTSAAL